MDRFITWADKRNIISVRSTMVYVAMWMTYRVTEWVFTFSHAALVAKQPGVETAAIIAACTAPVSLLVGAIFNIYANSAKEAK